MMAAVSLSCGKDLKTPPKTQRREDVGNCKILSPGPEHDGVYGGFLFHFMP